MRLALTWTPAIVLGLAACMKAPDPTGAFGQGRPDPHAGLDMGGAGAEAPATAPGRPVVEMDTPEGWQPVPPDQSFYLAKWVLPGEDPGICTITWLGGREDLVESNIQRWIGQFEVEGGADAVEQGSLEGARYPTRTVLLKGTLLSTGQVGGGEPRHGWMLAGAVVMSPAGPLYVKAVGPAAVLEGQLDAFWQDVAKLEVSGAGQAATRAPAQEATATPRRPTVKMEVPAGWQAEAPTLSFYLAKWVLPGDDPGVCTISWLGPRENLVDSNIQRWIGQFEVEGGADAVEQGTLEGARYPTRTVALKGTLLSTGQVGGGEPRQGWMLAGAVVMSPDGPLYVKAVGPAAVLEGQLDAFWKGVAGLEVGH